MQSCKLFYCITKTDDSAATIIIRLLMAAVFIPEGIQKFLFADILGSGRFMQIGIPYPNLLGPFIGLVEIVCGVLILVGLFTRLASLVILFDMIVAIISTKIPILLGHDWWIFHVAPLARYGFWSMMHEIRPDITMLLGSIYLLIRGAGVWSLDAKLSQNFCTR